MKNEKSLVPSEDEAQTTIIDLQATLLKVRSETKGLEDEDDLQYNARTLHLALLLIEHSPQNAVLMPAIEQVQPVGQNKEETN